MGMQSTPSRERVPSHRRLRKFVRRAARHLRGGHRDRAREDLRRALRELPETVPAYSPRIAKTLLAAADVAGNLDGSRKLVAHVEALVEEGPEDAEGWKALARLHLAAEAPEEGLKVVVRAAERFPADPDLPLLRARALRLHGSSEEADAVLWEVARHGMAWREALRELAGGDAAEDLLHAVRGHRLRDEGDVAGAEDAYAEALEANPRSQDALEGQAHLYAEGGRWEAVLAAVEEALSIGSTRASLWALKARAEEALGQPEEAIRSLQVCRRYDPEDPDTALRLAKLLHRQGRHEEAVELFGELGAEGVEDPRLAAAWRDALRAAESWPDLARLSRRLLQKDPQRTDLWLDIAVCEIQEGDRRDAREALSRGWEGGNPSDGDLRRMANLALRAEAWELASDAADRLLDRNRKDPVGLRCKGLALKGMGCLLAAQRVAARGARWHGDREMRELQREILKTLHRPRALIRCDRALVAQDPSAVEVYQEIARTYASLGKVRKALRWCERGLDANPETTALQLLRGELLTEAKRPEEALRAYERVAASDAGSAAAWRGQGRCLEALGSPDEAASAYRRAAEIEDEPETWYRLARCLEALDRPEEALACLDRAVVSNSPSAWTARGRVLMVLDRWQDALHSFDQVLGQNPEDVNARLQKAECLLALEDPRAALRALEVVEEAGKGSAAVFRTRVRCLQAAGRTREAFETAVTLTKAAPGDAQAWTLRARLARELGLVTEARYGLARAAKRAPRDPEPRAQEAAILLDLGNPQDALRLAEEALELDRLHGGAALVRARALAALDHGEAALQAFNDALEVSEETDRVLRGRALLLVDLGRADEAVETVERLADAQPHDAETHYWRSVVLGRSGRWEAALKAANQALYYRGARPEVLAQKVLALAELGREEEALSLLRSTVERGERDPSVVTALMTLLLRAGAYDEALTRADGFLGDNSRDDGMMLFRAQALGGLGRWDEAEQALELATQIRPAPPEVWIQLASLHRDQGRAAAAVACYDRAVAQAPDDPELWKGRGRLCAGLRRWEEALHSFGTVREADPTDEEALCGYGRAATALGRYDEAWDAYGRALELDPSNERAAQGRQQVEARRRGDRVAAYAWSLLELEANRRRPATREEAFRDCNVPRDLLGDVMSYVNEPDPLDILSLPDGEMQSLEELSRVVLAGSDGTGPPRLAQVVQRVPELGPGEARRVLGYVHGVLETDLPPDEGPGTERLMRLAMDLPEEAWTPVSLARELGVGAYRAKTLAAALRALREESQTDRTGPHRSRAPAASSEPRCHRHGAPGLYQHHCGQFLCSRCIVGGRCPVCRHPVSASGFGAAREGDEEPGGFA